MRKGCDFKQVGENLLMNVLQHPHYIHWATRSLALGSSGSNNATPTSCVVVCKCLAKHAACSASSNTNISMPHVQFRGGAKSHCPIPHLTQPNEITSAGSFDHNADTTSRQTHTLGPSR